MRTQQGITLLEAVVVLGMMIALMILVTMFFLRAQRFTILSDTYGQTQREATTLLRRISDELSRSTLQHVRLESDGSEVAFLSFSPAEPADPVASLVEFDEVSGEILWKKWVAIFFDGANQQVKRVEEPLDAPSSDLTASPEPAPDFVRYRSQSARVLASSVKELKVVPSLSGVNVSVTTAREIPLPMLSPDEKFVEIRVRMEVHLINSE